MNAAVDSQLSDSTSRTLLERIKLRDPDAWRRFVGLYGPTLAERSAPWRPRRLAVAAVDAGTLPCRPCEQRVCVPGDFRCLTGVPAGTVRDAARRLLESAS